MPTEVPTHCPYCALQCGMVLREDTTISVRPDDFPTNRGGLCQKGWTSAELLTSPDRLTTPLARPHRGAELAPVSWDDALDRIVREVDAIRRRRGGAGLAVFGSGGLTNEKSYLLGKFARIALGTPNIDYNGRFCMSSAAAAGVRSFGVDRGLPFPLRDIGQAGAMLLAGGNVAETMPPFMQYVDELRAGGGALIVVDPRRTPTAQQADLHLQITPGTDLALANGLTHIAIAEGHTDLAYVHDRTTGFDDVRRTVAAYWPQRVERITGVPVGEQYAAVRLLARAQRAIVLTARGAEQHSTGTDTVSALINLALVLGLPGTPGSGYGCLTGQGNGQGGREHGQKADQLPGARGIDDPAARAHVAAVWDVPAESIPGPGRSAYELLDALGTPAGPEGLLVFGSNVAVSAPRAGHIEDRLRGLPFLMVSDVVLSETARLADVVLPAAQWAEEDGTMTNLEGRVLRRRRLRPPPSGVRTDLEIVAALAGRLGHGARFDSAPMAVFEELRRASRGGPADYAPISYQRIDAEQGVFWGSPRMFLDEFGTPDGRARFVPVEHRGAHEEPDSEFPLYLTTGRAMQHYQSGAQTRRIRPLTEAVPRPYAEIHPTLAVRLGVADGATVRVVSRRGEAVVQARITDAIRADTVFVPFHWGGVGRINTVTNAALDPISGMPEFKVCAVRLEPA